MEQLHVSAGILLRVPCEKSAQVPCNMLAIEPLSHLLQASFKLPPIAPLLSQILVWHLVPVLVAISRQLRVLGHRQASSF